MYHEDAKVCTYCSKKNHKMILHYKEQKLFRIYSFYLTIGYEVQYMISICILWSIVYLHFAYSLPWLQAPSIPLSCKNQLNQHNMCKTLNMSVQYIVQSSECIFLYAAL